MRQALPYDPNIPSRAGVGGRKKTWEWTERWQCGRAEVYRDERQESLSPAKRRDDRTHESVKVGCKAHFFLRKHVGEDGIEVEYKDKHNGHQPGTVGDMASSMLTIRVREWVTEKVDRGLNWPAIKAMLRIDTDILDAVGYLLLLCGKM